MGILSNICTIHTKMYLDLHALYDGNFQLTCHMKNMSNGLYTTLHTDGP